ncbi:MAG: cell division protein FtsZ [Bacteroidales bacterium]|nr:cell division protein FtsZ [Bacteroidales bacterium]MCR5245602.1 cell division protein FtsZ [Bacteroidales bacterium]
MAEEIFFKPADWVADDTTIKVLGVGGGGCNAVNYMYEQGIKGCSFVVCNTDSMHLQRCSVPCKIQLGRGLGAGTNPTKGRNAALDSQEEIADKVLGGKTQMLFITAGMGGGTGTGATPVIAKMAKDKGILTVAVVTIPFLNEGNRALSRAIDGIHELEKNVDSLIIINNEKLYEFFGDQLIHDAFPKADQVLATAVRGIIEIIKKRGYINVDFEDVKTLMKDSGMALMGAGTGSGPNRIEEAVKEAFESPLLNDFDLKSAKNVLVNITGGKNEKGLTMNDLQEINKKIDEYTGGANKFKSGLIWDDDPEIGDTIHITSIVTGLRFSDVIDESVKNADNYIMIDKHFVFDKGELASGEGITLQGDGSSHIGFSSKDNERAFHYDPDNRPVLLVSEGQDISALENEPAIRRKPKKD